MIFTDWSTRKEKINIVTAFDLEANGLRGLSNKSH